MTIVTEQKHLLVTPCINAEALHAWVHSYCHIDVPRKPLCPHHHAPFDYLAKAYFEPASDLVVWAPRGGGKTRLAAVATMLDLLHKCDVEVRILAGSLEQARKMWDHLDNDLSPFDEYLGHSRFLRRSISLGNGAACGILTQSQKSVRGVRVQKLRCDEVELFDPAVWDAAQLTTRSLQDARPPVGAALEAISTLHTPFGLMNRVVEDAAKRKTPTFKWCILDVLEPCPKDRDCNSCPLHPECQGRAKQKDSGFLSIDDAIKMKERASEESWNAEMLCLKPSVRHSVFPTFNPATHVREHLPHPSPGTRVPGPDTDRLTLAIDFGFASPLVCLWIHTDDSGQTHILDEYVQPSRTLEEHLHFIESKPWPLQKFIACDPAGSGRSDQTATSNVQLLKSRGYTVKHRKSLIPEGLEKIRAALKPAHGSPRLFIHPRCQHLITALRSYRYAPGGSELPLKDGTHDHLIDALRYHFLNAPSLSEPKPWRRY